MSNECETYAPGHGPRYLLAELLDPGVPKTEREHVAAREIERLRKLLFRAGAMAVAPCFCCGYDGPGYFNPEIHPCAARHHELTVHNAELCGGPSGPSERAPGYASAPKTEE